MNVCSVAQTVALDHWLHHDIGLPELALMEHAGKACADAVIAWWGARPAPITEVWCGPGNNGGDGYVIARHLAIAGWRVRAVAVIAPTSSSCRNFAAVAGRLGLVGAAGAPELLIDAVFGIGQRAGSDVIFPRCPTVCVDVPTGVDADNGRTVGAIAPDIALVLSIGTAKPFLFCGDWAWSGRWTHIPLGFALNAPDLAIATLTGLELPPPLSPAANKWDRGHVGVVAGCVETPGAAVLAARACLRAGAGLVTLYPEAGMRLDGLPPEVMVSERAVGEHDALVVGPGLGRRRDALARDLWRRWRGPAVYDADALRVPDLGEPGGLRLITPHAGEAGAMLGTDWRAVEADRFAAITRLRGPRIAAVLKGACPLISGARPRVVEGRTPALGTAGSGDVLAGLAGAMLARARPTDPASVEAAALWAVSLQLQAGRSLRPGAFASEIADAVRA